MSKIKNISFRYGRRDVGIKNAGSAKRPTGTHTSSRRDVVLVHGSNGNVNLIALKIVIVIFDSMLARALAHLLSIDSKKIKVQLATTRGAVNQTGRQASAARKRII